MKYLSEPLAWYIAGPLIGLMVPALLLIRGKQFGISSTYRYLWAQVSHKPSYFSYASEQDGWQFTFVIGLILFGFLNQQIQLVPDALASLPEMPQVYGLSSLTPLFFGGILTGFGARYANGCTAGHCIMGMSQRSAASLLATLAFFVGGLLASLFLNPYLF